MSAPKKYRTLLLGSSALVILAAFGNVSFAQDATAPAAAPAPSNTPASKGTTNLPAIQVTSPRRRTEAHRQGYFRVVVLEFLRQLRDSSCVCFAVRPYVYNGRYFARKVAREPFKRSQLEVDVGGVVLVRNRPWYAHSGRGVRVLCV